MGYPKKHRGRRKMGSKKRRARKRNKRKQYIKITSFSLNTACRIYKKGKVVTTNLGHYGPAFKSTEFQKMIINSLYWVTS